MQELAKKTALITGATGFVGAHLARRLISEGWAVHAIVRPQSNTGRLQQLGIAIHQHDGSTDGMMDIVSKAKPEIVFHLASLFLAQHQPDDVVPLMESNVRFGAQLLEAMVANGVSVLVNTGTAWQHYENKAYSPVCLYAATKQAFEAILAYYAEATPLRAITLKLFDTYGPDDPRPKLLPLLQKVSLKQEPFPMSPGEQLLDLVHIDDVVEAYVAAAKRLLQGKAALNHEIFAVRSGDPLSLQDIVKVFESVTGRKVPVIWGGRPYRAREIMVPWSGGETLPDWQPRVSLAEGIRKLGL